MSRRLHGALIALIMLIIPRGADTCKSQTTQCRGDDALRLVNKPAHGGE